MNYRIALLLFGALVVGFVAGEIKYNFFDYWKELASFLDDRDEKVINKFKNEQRRKN